MEQLKLPFLQPSKSPPPPDEKGVKIANGNFKRHFPNKSE